MSHDGRGIVSAVIFALIWSAGMLWWFHPDPGVMHPAVIAAGAVFAGLLWHWVYKRLWRNTE